MAPLTTDEVKKVVTVSRNTGGADSYKAQKVTIGLLVGLILAVVFIAGGVAKVLSSVEDIVRNGIVTHRDQAAPHPALDKRFDKIDDKLDRQWRVMRSIADYGSLQQSSPPTPTPPRRTP